MRESTQKLVPAANREDADLGILFSMLAVINITAQPFAELFEDEYDISLHEWRIMHVIALAPGCSQTAVARALGLDKMTVSRAVGRLERKSRVKKAADPDNLRAARLRLTASGRRLHKLILRSGEERARNLFENFTGAERRTFSALIGRLLANARRMGEAEQLSD